MSRLRERRRQAEGNQLRAGTDGHSACLAASPVQLIDPPVHLPPPYLTRSFVTFAEDSSAEAVFSAGSMHELGSKRVEVKPATPKGSGSLSRSAGPSRPGASGGNGRPVPPYGGPGAASTPAALFGSPPGAYGATGFGMYAYPPGEQLRWGLVVLGAGQSGRPDGGQR